MAASARQKPAPANMNRSRPFSGFQLTETCVEFDDGKGGIPIFVCSRLEIVAETRNAHGESWGKLLIWRDSDGVQHEWPMSLALLAGDGVEVVARLLSGGLKVAAEPKVRKLLIQYLASTGSDARACCVDQPGWHGDAYVTSQRIYGDTSGERVVVTASAATAPPAHKGTLQGWQKEVAAHAVGNSRLVLAISSALAGPLLRIADEEGFGFHLSGGSSGGKTTAVQVAASVWGAPINSWRVTDNAAEGLARNANDGFLALDELSQADGHAASAMAYMLGNGQGKGRMTRDVSLKPTATWRVLFLSTGEEGLAEKMSEAGRPSKAGQAVRMIDVPSDSGVGLGLFENLHGFALGADFAQHFRGAIDRHCGHAISAFLEHISTDRRVTTQIVQRHMQKWLNEHLPVGADGQVGRVARRFALTAAAGELATEAEILPWPEGEASRGAAVCFASWIGRRGGIGSAESRAGLLQVKAFIEAHGASRFEFVGGGDSDLNSEKVINRAGFRRRTIDGRWEYLVMPEAWRNDVCRGLEPTTVAKDLIARGLLDPGREGRTAKAEYVPGHGKMRLYHLRADLMGKAAE